MSKRDELINKLSIDLYKSGLTDAEDFFTSFEGLTIGQKERWYRVAKYIISREAKIVEPLVKYKDECKEPWGYPKSHNAIDQTLKNAGVQV